MRAALSGSRPDWIDSSSRLSSSSPRISCRFLSSKSSKNSRSSLRAIGIAYPILDFSNVSLCLFSVMKVLLLSSYTSSIVTCYLVGYLEYTSSNAWATVWRKA